jgi:hypothetical protein
LFLNYHTKTLFYTKNYCYRCFFSSRNLHFNPSTPQPLMTSRDPRVRPGSQITSLASKLMRKADCIRYYGSNASKQTIKGTVISSKRGALKAGGSLRTIVTVDYYFNEGDIRRKDVRLRAIIPPLKDPPSQAPELPALVNTPMGVVEH